MYFCRASISPRPWTDLHHTTIKKRKNPRLKSSKGDDDKATVPGSRKGAAVRSGLPGSGVCFLSDNRKNPRLRVAKDSASRYITIVRPIPDDDVYSGRHSSLCESGHIHWHCLHAIWSIWTYVVCFLARLCTKRRLIFV